MKGVFAATALAALTGVASAANHRHAHELFAKRNATDEVCIPGCTTYWTTVTGEATLVPQKTTTTVVAALTSTTTAIVTAAPVTSSAEVVAVPVPTPLARSCPTPGTYSFPATTITVVDTTTVCGATSTQVPPGTHTVGGVTTVVETATTIVCPVATVQTSGTVTTSTIVETTYFCPEAGTYTIAPITTAVTESTEIVYPVPTSYNPGTYTAPELVVTVTKTGYVTYCPFASSGLPTTTAAPAPEPTTSTVAPAPPQTTQEAPQPLSSSAAPVLQSSSVPPVLQSSSAAPKPQSTSVASKPQASSGALVGTNDHYGITYTPYEPSDGNCKTASAVDSDISDIKNAGFQIVRVYSTDCNTLENVGNACAKYGLDMIIGVFVDGSGCDYNTPSIKEQVDAIAAWSAWDQVKVLIVGNEAIMNGFCTATELRSLILTVKSKCSGYTGPYSISETLNIWQQPAVSSAICDVVDVTGANVHAYFNSGCSASGAGAFVAGQIALLDQICTGKTALVLESGWPTKGDCNGEACPGESEQSTAIQSIRETCGDRVVFFSMYDDLWKEAGSCQCEQSWGISGIFSI